MHTHTNATLFKININIIWLHIHLKKNNSTKKRNNTVCMYKWGCLYYTVVAADVEGGGGLGYIILVI